MKILAVGAHPDDVEIGCGATLADRHDDVTIATFTTCGIAEEWRKSMAVLQPDRSILYNYAKRVLDILDVREEIRALLEQLRDEVCPAVVFTHHPSNPHQDHQVLFEECQRVFKRHTLIGYSVAGWYTPNLYVPVSEEAVKLKRRMLRCYKSQEYHSSGLYRYSRDPDAIMGVLTYHGMQVSERYAEAFELLRGVWRRSA
jgi:LmbE family N-acetylglucosaminyl deacetylase